MNIGQRIKILRTELGMSQTELAQKMGYTSRTTISKIESGDIKVTTEDAVRFADALNSNIRLLMGWEESNNTLTNLPGQMSLLDMTNAEEITMNESMLLSTYRSLSDTTKENAFRILTIYDKADAVQKDLIDGLIDSFEEMQNLHQKISELEDRCTYLHDDLLKHDPHYDNPLRIFGILAANPDGFENASEDEKVADLKAVKKAKSNKKNS